MAGDEARFLIDGAEYPWPGIETMDMDDAQLLYDYSGVALEDFAPEQDEDLERERQQRLRNPGVMRAFLHIAYQRGNPDVKPAEVKQLIARVREIEAMSPMGRGGGEGDADPPALSATTKNPDASSPSASSETGSSERPSPAISGIGSEYGSAAPGSHQETTGATRSAISATLDRKELAV